jgi:hypothetical protein
VKAVRGDKGLEIESEGWKIERCRDSAVGVVNVSIAGRNKRVTTSPQRRFWACAPFSLFFFFFFFFFFIGIWSL